MEKFSSKKSIDEFSEVPVVLTENTTESRRNKIEEVEVEKNQKYRNKNKYNYEDEHEEIHIPPENKKFKNSNSNNFKNFNNLDEKSSPTKDINSNAVTYNTNNKFYSNNNINDSALSAFHIHNLNNHKSKYINSGKKETGVEKDNNTNINTTGNNFNVTKP
jgi:hypothetical protein